MWNIIVKRGPAVAFWLLALAAQVSGYTNAAIALALVGIAAFFLIAPAYHYIREWRAQRIGHATLGTAQILLLVGIGGTWLFMTMALSAVGWLIWNGGGLGASTQAQEDPRPLRFLTQLEVNGDIAQTARFVIFRGWNASQQEVHLKDANITSALNGARMTLEVDAGQDGMLAISEIGLIPPGAPIRLQARFNPPAGILAQDFLSVWRQFFLNVEDDKDKYRIPFNEGNLAVFFPGMVGPHIAKKTNAN